MAKWKKCTLGDLVTFQRGHDLPRTQMKAGDYPVIGSNGIIGYHNAYTTEAPSITVGRSGNVGKPFIYYGRTWSHNTSLYIKDFKGNDPVFIYYFLQTLNLTHYAGGSAVPTLNRNHIHALDVCVPCDVNGQRTIGRYLQLLDEKITENQNINKNLEQQALAIFRQYFMDFAPYGGVAPSDWMEVSLDDVCIRITDGSHYSPADSPDSPYPMYSVKDMETYGFNSSTCKHITEDEFRKMKKSDCVPLLNDILVAKDGSYLKEIFICSEEKEEAILSSIAIFRPNTSVIMPEILLYFLKQPSVRKDVGDNYVSGSALPRIVLKDFKKYRLTLPTMNEQLKIGSVLHAIRMQTKANIDEIQRLSSIRDTLLPQLMSGNLDVSALDI